jgi:hypothetical protein
MFREGESKVHSPVGFATTRRARALSAACGVALVAMVAVGTVEKVRAAAQSATAVPSELFGVHPVQEGRTTLPGGHFNFALVAGQRISDGIVVVNFSSHSLRFHVYGADLLMAIGGGLAPAQPTATMHEVGAWIAVSAPVMTIAAHSQATDDFTLTVPNAAAPGQHLGGVVAAADIGVTADGNPIEARAALIAVVTVPGAAHPSARLTALFGSSAGPRQFGFRITVANTGNVLLTYAGSVMIDDANGHTIAKLALTPTNAYIVPGGLMPLDAAWKEPRSLAPAYRARAMVTILANGVPVGTLTSQSLAVLFPGEVPLWFLVGSALGILVMLVLATWAGRRVARWRHRMGVRRVLGTGPAG